MTLCVKTGYQCVCQPDEGVFCPDYKPDAYVQCLMDAITELRALQSETARRAFEEKPVAWLIERPKGTGKQQTTEFEVVLSPLTDDTFMDEGDQAWPLFRQVYTQEGLDAAEARAAERHKKLRIE